jgi:hypothetical protein
VCVIAKVLETKKFGSQRLIWHLGNYLPFNFGNSIITHTKEESGIFVVVNY